MEIKEGLFSCNKLLQRSGADEPEVVKRKWDSPLSTPYMGSGNSLYYTRLAFKLNTKFA